MSDKPDSGSPASDKAAPADIAIQLAAALEQQRAYRIVEDVSATRSSRDMREAFDAGFVTACEEIMERLKTEEFQALGDLLDVLEATGRGLRGNSETVEKAVTLRGMSREATGLAGMAAAVADTPGRMLQGELGQWIREVRLGNHAEKVAEIITSPQSMEKLRQLKKLSPRDARFIAGMNQLVGFGAQVGVRGVIGARVVRSARPNPAM